MAVCNAIFSFTISCWILEMATILETSDIKLWSSLNFTKFLCFWAANFFFFGGGGVPNFWVKNLGHYWTCSKVWWWSTEWTRRSGSEKKQKKNKVMLCKYLKHSIWSKTRDSRKSRKHGNHDFRQMPWFCRNTVFAVFLAKMPCFYNNILFFNQRKLKFIVWF